MGYEGMMKCVRYKGDAGVRVRRTRALVILWYKDIPGDDGMPGYAIFGDAYNATYTY